MGILSPVARYVSPHFTPQPFDILRMHSGVLSIHKFDTVVDTEVNKPLVLETIVRTPTIAYYSRTRKNSVFNDFEQSFLGPVRYWDQETLRCSPLYTTKNPFTFNSTTTVVFSFAEFCFVNFDNTTRAAEH